MPYKKNPFVPNQKNPFRVSRSKIDLFLECPRCFYLEQRLGVSRPSMPSFTLNNAVDFLLKKEFDLHRTNETTHPLMKNFGLDAVPFAHEMMDEWRHNFTGVQYLDKEDNLLIFGAVDDIWKNNKTGELHVVDYKATSKDKEVKELEDTRWHNQYRRQMEVYQWLLRKNNFEVSNTGYFVYVNGQRDKEAFDAKLEFDVNIIPYTGNADWVDEVLPKIKSCLVSPKIPKSGQGCEFCEYRESAGKAFKDSVMSLKKEDIEPLKTDEEKKPVRRVAKKKEEKENTDGAKLF